MDAVQETFVDAFGEISFKHGMIRIELVSLSGPEPRVAQRLITSLQAFTQMLQAQNGMFEQLEKAGLLRAAGGTTPGPVAPSRGADKGGEEAPANEAAEERAAGAVPEETASVSVGAAVRRLLGVEPVPSPAAPAADSEPPRRTDPTPPRSPNFRQG